MHRRVVKMSMQSVMTWDEIPPALRYASFHHLITNICAFVSYYGLAKKRKKRPKPSFYITRMLNCTSFYPPISRTAAHMAATSYCRRSYATKTRDELSCPSLLSLSRLYGNISSEPSWWTQSNQLYAPTSIKLPMKNIQTNGDMKPSQNFSRARSAFVLRIQIRLYLAYLPMFLELTADDWTNNLVRCIWSTLPHFPTGWLCQLRFFLLRQMQFLVVWIMNRGHN